MIFLVLKLDIFKYVNLEKYLNIELISVRFWELKLDKSKDVKELQELNILLILVIFCVLKWINLNLLNIRNHRTYLPY